MTKMLAGQITGKRLLEMIEIPMPDIEGGEILVKLRAPEAFTLCADRADGAIKVALTTDA